MKNVAAITGSIAITLATSLIQPPSAEARFKGTNEKTWYRSIQADIKNGASARTICRNASSPAEVSDEVAFKNWAYGIGRMELPANTVQKAMKKVPLPQTCQWFQKAVQLHPLISTVLKKIDFSQ